MGKNTAKPRAAQLRPAQPRAAHPSARPASDQRVGKLLMWGVIGLIVALAIGIAIWSTSGGDDSSSPGATSAGPATTIAGGVAPGEYQPVTVTGQALAKFGDATPDAGVGSTPPALRGYGLDGAPITITPGEGGPMLVAFFAHWCPHCNNELPVLAEWRKAGRVPVGLQVFGVNTGVNEQAPNYPPSKWLPTMEWAWPVLADSASQEAAVAWGLPSYPYFVVVGGDGKVKVRATGEMPLDQFDQLVRNALAS